MNEQVECPVCMTFIDKNKIEQHVDDCLQKSKKANLQKKSVGIFYMKDNANSRKREAPLNPLIGATPGKKKKIDSIDLENAKPKEKTIQYEKINTNVKTTKAIVLGKIPLAEQMRPTTFQEYFFAHFDKEKDFLYGVLNSGIVPSMLLWGPPGCGKTSLATVISNQCKTNKTMRFVTLSATSAGVNDVKEAVKVAKNERRLTQRKTILFIDEVHRFNKLQQDTFLPHVEDGTIILIGATTENPSFYLNNALISRCRVVMLKALGVDDVRKILEKAVKRLNGVIREKDEKVNITDASFFVEQTALESISNSTNGDARIALNTLDLILQAKLTQKTRHGDATLITPLITTEEVDKEIRRNYVNYDKKGDEHYDIISALHKSIRGSDENAAIYWLARMLEGGEQPLYIARRLVRCASEDIGLADPSALQQAVSGYQACHFIGMPECNVILAQVVTYLARAPKSIEVYEALNEASSIIRQCKGAQPKVPLHLRNAPTKLMKDKGYGDGYKYTPKCLDNPDQDYLPKELIGSNFFK